MKPESILVKWLAFSLILIVGFSLYLRSPGSPKTKLPQDFGVYLMASEKIKAGASPYASTDELPYKYAPSMTLPIRLLPSDPLAAWKVFGSLSLLGLVLTLLLGFRYRRWSDLGLLTLGLALSWKGILETLDYGQLEFFLLFFMTLAALFWKKSTFRSGMILGSLPWLKLPWLVYSAPFLIRSVIERDVKRLIKFVLGYTMTSLFWLVLLPAVTFGITPTRRLTEQWFELLKSQPHHLFFSDMNQGIWLFFLNLSQNFGTFEALGQSVALTVGAFVVGALGIFLCNRDLRNRPFAIPNKPLIWISPWLLYGQLVSPLAWRWASLLLVGLPFAIPDNPLIKNRRVRLFLYSIIALLWLVQQNPITQLAGYHWTALHPYHVITFYWFFCLILVL